MKTLLLQSKNKEVTDYTLIDDKYYEILNKYNWHKNKNYASGRIKGSVKLKVSDFKITEDD
jgi:hypothetical protein